MPVEGDSQFRASCAFVGTFPPVSQRTSLFFARSRMQEFQTTCPLWITLQQIEQEPAGAELFGCITPQHKRDFGVKCGLPSISAQTSVSECFYTPMRRQLIDWVRSQIAKAGTDSVETNLPLLKVRVSKPYARRNFILAARISFNNIYVAFEKQYSHLNSFKRSGRFRFNMRHPVVV